MRSLILYILVTDPCIVRDNFYFYDCVIILNIFQCIPTYAALYMYDQCIVGFMMIGAIGLGIRHGKDTTIIFSFQFGRLLTIALIFSFHRMDLTRRLNY